jgi:hypothetical protein
LIIDKIKCGKSHSLLLSNEGIIYGLGKHFSRKLDFRFTEPLKLNHSKKFIEIATHWSQDFSVALSEEDLYYICDKLETNGEVIVGLKETSNKFFNKIFIKYSQIAYEPMLEKIFEFEDSFIRNNRYKNKFDEYLK